jgi:hypothetical protein
MFWQNWTDYAVMKILVIWAQFQPFGLEFLNKLEKFQMFRLPKRL